MNDRGAVIVTGASRGIGAAAAVLATQAGYAVTLIYATRDDRAAQVVAQIEAAGGKALAIRMDVGDEAAVRSAFERTRAQFGRIHGLVNNAAITGGHSRMIDTELSTLREVIDANVVGAWLCAREAIRCMAKSRGGAGGVIVNVSSNAARKGSPNNWIHYAMTKGALDTMTVGLGAEMAPDGIRVVGVRPGLADTDIHKDRDAAMTARMTASIPMGRMSSPEEVARVIVWALSAEASYVTATTIDVTGGY